MFKELEVTLKRIEETLTAVIAHLTNNPAHNANGKRKILSAKELCELLQISEASRMNYVRRGLIPQHRVGRRVFYLEDEVLAAIAAKNKKKAA